MGERDTDGCAGVVPVAVPMAVPPAVPVAVPTAVPVGITLVPVAVALPGGTTPPVVTTKQMARRQVRQGPCEEKKKETSLGVHCLDPPYNSTLTLP